MSTEKGLKSYHESIIDLTEEGNQKESQPNVSHAIGRCGTQLKTKNNPQVITLGETASPLQKFCARRSYGSSVINIDDEAAVGGCTTETRKAKRAKSTTENRCFETGPKKPPHAFVGPFVTINLTSPASETHRKRSKSNNDALSISLDTEPSGCLTFANATSEPRQPQGACSSRGLVDTMPVNSPNCSQDKCILPLKFNRAARLDACIGHSPVPSPCAGKELPTAPRTAPSTHPRPENTVGVISSACNKSMPVTDTGNRRKSKESGIPLEEMKMPAAEASRTPSTQDDAPSAEKLQRREMERVMKKKYEKEAMKSAVSGRAWLFVKQVLDVHARLQTNKLIKETYIDAVAVDDLVALAERMMDAQNAFREKNRPILVDLGYHYTQERNMNNIRQDGLMNFAEREKNCIKVARNGAYFGDGIYTANNPYAFRQYGEVGLIVARLQGYVKRVSGPSECSDSMENVDTIVGNKGAPEYFDEVILTQRAQCLPLVHFPSSLVSLADVNSAGNKMISCYHRILQRVVDGAFNNGHKTKVIVRVPSFRPVTASATARSGAQLPASMASGSLAAAAAATVGSIPTIPRQNIVRPGVPPLVATATAASAVASSAPSATGQATAKAPVSVPIAATRPGREVLRYIAPMTLAESLGVESPFRKANSSDLGDNCPICLVPLCSTGEAVCLNVCGHNFHEECIKKALKLSVSKKCPVCCKSVLEPQGKAPSGLMTIKTSSIVCQGFESTCAESIVITYDIPSDVQKSYHENPGQMFSGTIRVAYLPNNDDGKNLLKRLKYAFMKGLTFAVGTSLTTGRSNCVVWSSIHHKTKPAGGYQVHGFPDSGYILNCNDELTALGVPAAGSLP